MIACSRLALVLPVLPLAVAPLAAQATDGDDVFPWAAVYGTDGAEQVLDVAPAPDGGVVVLANAFDPATGDTDAWLVRLDRRGGVLWERTIGGAGRDELVALAVRDDGLLAAGVTSSFGNGGLDGWIVKLAPDGSIAWERAIGGSDDEELSAIALTGNLAVAAGRAVDTRTGIGDAWVLALDIADGAVAWQQLIGGDQDEFPSAVAATSNGGVAVVVNTNSDLGKGVPRAPFIQPWVIRLDRGGAVVWQRTYDVSGGDYWSDLIALPGGGFVATGEVLSAAFFRGDLWVVRLDDDGEVVWDTRLGDNFGNNWVDAGRQVVRSSDGGFVVAGSSGTVSPGGEDLWLVKVDANGQHLWNRAFGGSSFDNGIGVVRAGSGYVLAGFSSSFGSGLPDAIALRVSAEGRLGDCGIAKPGAPNIWTGALMQGSPQLAPRGAGFASVPGLSPIGRLGVQARSVCR